MQFLQSLFKFLSYVPFISIVLLYLSIPPVVIELGHFPAKYIDNHTDLDVGFLREIVLGGLVSVFYVFPFWLALLIVSFFENWNIKRSVFIFFLGVALFLILLRLDPFNFIDWWWDWNS